MWFSPKPCAVCQEKDRRIADLYNQIADLRRLAIPPTAQDLLTPSARETDLILNPDVDTASIQDAEYEAAALLSGTYDHAHVDLET